MRIKSFFTKQEQEYFADIALDAAYNPAKAHKYSIGLDPGVNTGFCLYDKTAKKIVKLDTLEFWELFDALDEIKQYIAPQLLTFHIENSALNKPTFVKAGGDTQKKVQKISRNVGSNQRESTLLIEGIRRYGFSVIEVKPTGIRGQKRKWDESFFQKVTGYTGRSSQHARDAAMLVYGR